MKYYFSFSWTASYSTWCKTPKQLYYITTLALCLCWEIVKA